MCMKVQGTTLVVSSWMTFLTEKRSSIYLELHHIDQASWPVSFQDPLLSPSHLPVVGNVGMCHQIWLFMSSENSTQVPVI